jgi:hypothetical protein
MTSGWEEHGWGHVPRGWHNRSQLFDGGVGFDPTKLLRFFQPEKAGWGESGGLDEIPTENKIGTYKFSPPSAKPAVLQETLSGTVFI